MQDSKRAQFLWVGDPIGDVFAGGPPKPGVMVTMTSSPDLKTAVSDVQTADFAGIVIHLQAAVGPPDLDAARQLKSRAGETPFIVVAREEVGPTDVALAQAVGAADLVTRSLWPHLWKNKLALYIDLHQARSRLQPAAQPAAAALRESNERGVEERRVAHVRVVQLQQERHAGEVESLREILEGVRGRNAEDEEVLKGELQKAQVCVCLLA